MRTRSRDGTGTLIGVAKPFLAELPLRPLRAEHERLRTLVPTRAIAEQGPPTTGAGRVSAPHSAQISVAS